jgi:choloylglycine hydrolase
MIGMAVVEDGYPLYYEATNETGLSMAALNFPGNAHYFPVKENKDNIASFELIPWVLSQCNDLNEAKQKFAKLNITNVAFSDKFPTSPLHWMVCDATGSLVVEQTEAGLAVYEDPVGVLTNNPPFPYHLYNLNNYLHVTASEPVNRFSSSIELTPYSRGMGGIGLPGDLSSASRFVRASFTKLNSVSGESEFESISQFFHILDSVAQQRGCAKVGDAYEITLYSSCCDTNTGTYYYKTYENSQITGIKMHNCDLNENRILTFPLVAKQNIRYMN